MIPVAQAARCKALQDKGLKKRGTCAAAYSCCRHPQNFSILEHILPPEFDAREEKMS